MPADDLTRRIEELESQAAFQDELHEKLNDIVARQDGEIQRLKQQLSTLAERLQDLRDGSTSPSNEVPPHY